MASEITLEYTNDIRTSSYEMGTRTGFVYPSSTSLSNQISAIYIPVTECNEYVLVNGKLYWESWMKKDAYADLRYSYADLVLRNYDGTTVRYHNVATLEDEWYTGHSITEGEVQELGYVFHVRLDPEMFINADLTLGRIEWHFNEELFGVGYFNIQNNVPPGVSYYRKMDLWSNAIPPVIRLSQDDIDYRLIFEIFSSKSTFTVPEDSRSRTMYITEFRTTLKDDQKIAIRGRLEKLRRYSGIISSSRYYDFYYATTFIPYPELTENPGEYPFEIALLKVTQWNGTVPTPVLSGSEISTCNGRLIIEPKP